MKLLTGHKARFIEAVRPAEAYWGMFQAFGGVLTRKGFTMSDVVYDRETEIYSMKGLDTFGARVTVAQDRDKEFG